MLLNLNEKKKIKVKQKTISEKKQRMKNIIPANLKHFLNSICVSSGL